MPLYPEQLLDQIRSALLPSEVIGRRHKLRKQGREFVMVDDESISINDQKRMWYDFGKGKEGGDIFRFLVDHEGLSFKEAVETCAEQAGINLESEGRKRRSNGQDRSAESDPDRVLPRNGERHSEAAPEARRGSRHVVATWDYVDPVGHAYQVVRAQRKLPDDSWELNKSGKVWKTFSQRRPSPDGDGTWLWGLETIGEDGELIEFMRRGPGADWSRFDSDKFEDWHFRERRTFPGQGNVTHWLYQPGDIADELREERDDQRTVFIPEGEGKVDLLRSWGLLATCNSGGAGNWTEQHAEFLRGAADIVILQDHDLPDPKTGKRAGYDRTCRMVPMLRDVDARVRVIDFKDHWKDCPNKGDVVDWAARGGGDREKLLQIVDRLPEWKPEPYRSRYGAVQWGEQYASARRQYEYLIQGIVPRWQMVYWYGESQVGKSFEVLNCAGHVMRGLPYAGRSSVQGGIVVIAAEKGDGYRARMNAFQRHHDISRDEPQPFAVLTKPVNLFLDDKEADNLIAEIKGITESWTVPLEVVVLDTYQAATPGASIIKDEDITKVLARCRHMMAQLTCGMWIVHHKNAQGGWRGSLVPYNAAETAIELSFLTEGLSKNPPQVKDGNGLAIRRCVVRKQSEGQAGLHWDFVLPQVGLGTKDRWGEEQTSCVSVEPDRGAQSDFMRDQEQNTGKRKGPPGACWLNRGQATFVRALLKSLDERGTIPPPMLRLPASVSRVVDWRSLQDAYKAAVPIDDGSTPEGRKKYVEKVRKAMTRAREELQAASVIVVHSVTPEGATEAVHYLWMGGRPVTGWGVQWPRHLFEQKDKAPLLAPGEKHDDITKVY